MTNISILEWVDGETIKTETIGAYLVGRTKFHLKPAGHPGWGFAYFLI